MTSTNDAIAAFLAKGGAIAKLDATASSGMTDRQWHRAARDVERTTLVSKIEETQTRAVWECFKALLSETKLAGWNDSPRERAYYERELSTRVSALNVRVLEYDKALKAFEGSVTEYEKLDLYNAQSILSLAERTICKLLREGNFQMSNDTYEHFNGIYVEIGLRPAL